MIYLDHNATTPLRPEVLEAMLPYLREEYGNPSSVHQWGSRARCAVEEARVQVAGMIGATAAEILFTSGGTESNASALHVGEATTTPIEHSSVLAWCGLRDVDVDSQGVVDIASLRRALTGKPGRVSIGWANNEIGTIQPMEDISSECRAAGVPLHSDAVQAVGKIPVRVAFVDSMTLSAHKLGGPKGVGALYVRKGTSFQPLLRGGSQERERRAGTENVAGIVGMGEACRLAALEIGAFAESCVALRDALWEGLAGVEGMIRHTPRRGCLPNTLHVRFDGVRGEALVAALDIEGIAVSSGSACAAGAGEPSHVLAALGCDRDQSRNGVRFSVGRGNTLEQMQAVAATVHQSVARIRRAHGGGR